LSLTAALASAVSGLNVAQRALAVTANNVANANTEGYSRKVVNQQAVVVGDRGAGVQATGVTRLTDDFLTQEIRNQSSVAGRSDVLQRYQDLLQDAFGTPGDGHDLATQIGNLQTAIDALAGSPESSTMALQVVQAAGDVTQSLGSLADQVQVLRGQADQAIGQTVDEVNSDLQSIHDLNVEIQRQAATGDVSPDLLDQRDQLVNSLAQKIDIQTSTQNGNGLAIYTAGGETLLDSTPRVVTYRPAATVTASTPFDQIAIFRQDQIDPTTGAPIDPTAGVQLVSSGIRSTLNAELQNDAVPDADQQITSRVTGGQLAGLLETRDSILPALDDQLQELADGLRFALNAAHNDGSPVPPPSQLTGTRSDLSDFAGATRSGTATIAVVDRTDGSTQLAFQVDVGAAADANALAAQINSDLGSYGSAAIGADGNLEITLANSNQGLAINEGDSSITVTDAAGRDRDYGFANYFGLNDLLVQTGGRASDLAVRADIQADPSLLSTAELDVQTAPLTATLGGSGDNRAVQALADALSSPLAVIARGGLPAKSQTLVSYAGDIIAHSASLAQSAEQAATRDSALADQLNYRAASVSGVNLDEEMARLVQLQQAYAASARVVTVTNDLFGELLNMVR
jgi:flagellar hook-associated protein 1 FlgK